MLFQEDHLPISFSRCAGGSRPLSIPGDLSCICVVKRCTNLKGSSTALSDSCGQRQGHSLRNVFLHPVGEQRSSLDAKVLLVDQPDPLDHVLLGVRVQGYLSLFFIFFHGLAGISKLVTATFLTFMASLLNYS